MISTLNFSPCDPPGIAIKSININDFKDIAPYRAECEALDYIGGFGAVPAPFRPVG